jgi:hypothetical protein
MINNAYIATDNKTVMKVGKSNNLKQREKDIALPITFMIPCLDELAARKVETKLRKFIVNHGGIKYRSRLDWFEFDPQIYNMLLEFAAGLYDPGIIEDNLDKEMVQVVRHYYLTLLDGTAAEKERLLREKVELEQQMQRFREGETRHWELVRKLERDVGIWKGKCELLGEQLAKRGVRR